MAYTSFTQNDLTKWWITGTGSVLNRLSEVMDDSPLGPCIQQLDAANAWQANGATTDEFIIAQATKPDSVWENLSGWRQMTNVADDTAEDALNADEWTWYTGGWTVVRLSDDSDPNDTDMREFYAWDGSGAGPTFMTEIIENRIYIVRLNLEIGNDITPTTLISLGEYVYFDDGVGFDKQNNVTLNLGAKVGNWGTNGSTWNFGTSNPNFIGYGTGNLGIYDSHIIMRTDEYIYLRYGTIEILNSSMLWEICSTSSARLSILNNLTSLTMRKFYIGKANIGIYTQVTAITPTYEDIHVHNVIYGVRSNVASSTIYGCLVTNHTYDFMASGAGGGWSLTVIDPINGVTNPVIGDDSTNTIHEKYTCNIKVKDNAGVALQSVVVDCEDVNTDAVWAAGTVSTDASGDIAEQQIAYKKWYGASETLTEYSPHKFTFLKAGYKTLVKDNITVDSLIAWEIELQYVAGARNQTVGMGVRMS